MTVERAVRQLSVLAAAVVVAAGCSGGDRGATIVAATTSAVAVAAPSTTPRPSNEQQIRDLYAKAVTAMRALDLDAALALKCTKLHAGIREQFETFTMPMSQWGTPAYYRSVGVDKLVRILAPQFVPASEATVRQMAEAMVADDQAAFDRAVKEVMKQALFYDLVVRDIKVTGNTATADVTTTLKLADKTQTKSKQNQLIREDGRWKDCTPKAEGER